MRKQHLGLTFIEVLIALFILVTGILGAVAMQASAKKGSFDAMQRSLASALAQDIIERMRNNDPNLLEGYEGTDYGATLNSAPGERCNSQASICTPADLQTNDKYEWEAALMGADVKNDGKNAGGLVGARGCISHTNNEVIVVVSWQGRESISDGVGASDEEKACGTAGDKRRQVMVKVFII